jgi:putative transposase
MSFDISKDQPLDRAEGRWSDLARKKAEIIAPLLGLTPIPADLLAQACRSAGVLLSKPEGEVSHQTIRNWLHDFERDGLDGLERRPRCTKDKTRLPPVLAEAIRGWVLSPKKYSIAKVHRLAIRYARNVLKLEEPDLPSYKQVEYIADRIPDDEKLLAHAGVRAFRAARDMHVRFEAEYANQIWQCDHHQLDMIVVDHDTAEELGRPWITKVQDDYSRAICGYHLSLDDPSSISIALALRHAMLPKADPRWPIHGIPSILYIDNGKDFSSRHIEDVALHFGIELHFHEPYHPQAKGKIERIFRTLEEMCIHDLDGYVGSNPQKRPRRVTPKRTLAQVAAEIDQFIFDYLDRPHGTTKMKPHDRWLDSPRAIRTVDKPDDLDYLLRSTTRKVRKDGIHFNNAIYLDRDGVLQKYIGMSLLIFYDPRDYMLIRIYSHQQGQQRFLCEAVAQTTKDNKISAATIAEQNRRRRQALSKQIRGSQHRGNQALHALQQAETPLAPEAAGDPQPGTSPQEKQIAHQAHSDDDEPTEAEIEALRRRLQYRYKGASS